MQVVGHQGIIGTKVKHLCADKTAQRECLLEKDEVRETAHAAHRMVTEASWRSHVDDRLAGVFCQLRSGTAEYTFIDCTN